MFPCFSLFVEILQHKRRLNHWDTDKEKQTQINGDAEIARTDIARLDNEASDKTEVLNRGGPEQKCSRKYSSWCRNVHQHVRWRTLRRRQRRDFNITYLPQVLFPLCASNYQAHQQNRPERGVRIWRGRPERRSVSGESAADASSKSAIAHVGASCATRCCSLLSGTLLLGTPSVQPCSNTSVWSDAAFSSLFIWKSHDVHPCYLVPRGQVSWCPFSRFQRPRFKQLLNI